MPPWMAKEATAANCLHIEATVQADVRVQKCNCRKRMDQTDCGCTVWSQTGKTQQLLDLYPLRNVERAGMYGARTESELFTRIEHPNP